MLGQLKELELTQRQMVDCEYVDPRTDPVTRNLSASKRDPATSQQWLCHHFDIVAKSCNYNVM